MLLSLKSRFRRPSWPDQPLPQTSTLVQRVHRRMSVDIQTSGEGLDLTFFYRASGLQRWGTGFYRLLEADASLSRLFDIDQLPFDLRHLPGEKLRDFWQADLHLAATSRLPVRGHFHVFGQFCDVAVDHVVMPDPKGAAFDQVVGWFIFNRWPNHLDTGLSDLDLRRYLRTRPIPNAGAR